MGKKSGRECYERNVGGCAGGATTEMTNDALKRIVEKAEEFNKVDNERILDLADDSHKTKWEEHQEKISQIRESSLPRRTVGTPTTTKMNRHRHKGLTETESLNFSLFIGRYQVKDDKIVDSDIFIEKQQQAKVLIRKKNALQKMLEVGQELQQNFDRYEWWSRFSKNELEATIKSKQDEIMKLRILATDSQPWYHYRITELDCDIYDIESVLAIKKQSSIPKDVKYGVYAQQCKEHWEKMEEYSKKIKKLSEEFEKGLPSWMGGCDKSWLVPITGAAAGGLRQ
jgi:hypothetical protein